MYDNLYGVQDIRGSTSVDLSKEIVVCPLLSFYFLFLFFLFLCGLNGSFYLTLICLLWDLLICPLWDLFLTLGAALYILQEVYEIFHTLQKYSRKEDVTIMMQMYASACVVGYAMIPARHVAMIRAMP